LRKTKNLERIVFVSCDAKSALRNFTDLGRAASKTLSGLPFVPVAVVPIDLFPHTSHYELVIYFERLDIAQARWALPSSLNNEELIVENELSAVESDQTPVQTEQTIDNTDPPAVQNEEATHETEKIDSM
jgi:tRNA (uracil-5-)-methyltransferase